jgi:hypothetical protein
MEGGHGTLLRIKKMVCLSLLLSTLALPATAFASSNGSSNYSNQTLNQILSFLSSYNKYNDDDRNHRDHEKDFNDWYDKYKDDRPPEESYDIWKKWFCN